METRTNHRARLLAVVIACFTVACLALAACGGSASSSAANSASASGSSASASASASSDSASASASTASASSSAASKDDGFVGTWQLAAAEMQGLTMGGNFGQMLGVDNGFTMTINADGTGKMTFGDETTDLTWAENDASSIYVTPQSSSGAMKQEATLITLKDGALFMPYEQDGQQASIIFTHDGNYAGAKQISLADAKPITAEADLLGTWKLTGMNMGGISMYGDAKTMAAAMGGEESWVTFKEGGVAEMSSGNGSWAVSSDGATITITDITGTNTLPVLKLDNEIAIDYTAVFGGTEFIMVMAKA